MKCKELYIGSVISLFIILFILPVQIEDDVVGMPRVFAMHSSENSNLDSSTSGMVQPTITTFPLAKGEAKTELLINSRETYEILYSMQDRVLFTISREEPISNPGIDIRRSYQGITEGDVISETIQSHYCACALCCGEKQKFVTAGGITIWNGMENPRIVACNWLPIGSLIKIGDITYTVMDRGGANRLNEIGGVDVFVPEGHSYAYEKGLVRNQPITILKINY